MDSSIAWAGTRGKGHNCFEGEEKNIMLQPVGLIWGIVTLIFGILVMVYPALLRYTVGIYLVIVGLWAIIPRLHF
jgi:uncharacterized membrane protein HdeD (DUF308 family)